MTKSTAIKKTRTSSLLTALFIAANIGLPHLFHLIPGGGVMFLPIYFFTAFAAVIYGKRMGILTGIMSPLMGYLIFEAPKASLIPDMILKGVLLSVMLTYFLDMARLKYSNAITFQVLAIPFAVMAAWMSAGIMEVSIGLSNTAFQDFFTGIPGLLMMTLSGWIALFFNKRIAR